MPKAAREIQIHDNNNHQVPANSAQRKKFHAAIPRTTIQITQLTKTTLEQVKEIEHLEPSTMPSIFCSENEERIYLQLLGVCRSAGQ